MKHFKIIEEEQNNEERILAVVGLTSLLDKPTPKLQL